MFDFKPGDLVRLTGEDWWRHDLYEEVVEVIGRDELGPRVARKHNDGVHYRIFKERDRDYSADLVEAAPLAIKSTATSPSYYKFPGGVEVQQISSHLTSNAGQALQYIARSGRFDGDNKGDPIENYEKAKMFIDFEIARLKEAK